MPTQKKTRNAVSRVTTGVGLALALSMAVTACGSGSGSGSDNAAKGGGDSAFAADAAKAKALVEKYSATPPSIGITDPVGKPVPSDKTVVLIGGGQGAAGTDLTYDSFKAAAKAVGWTVKEIDPQEPTPQEMQQALSQATRLNPSAVIISAVSVQPIMTQLKQLQAKGVPVISFFGSDPASGPLTLQLDNGPERSAAMADLAVANLDKPGKLAVIGLQGYQIIQDYVHAFSAEVKRICSQCEVKESDVSLESLGTSAGTDIVNFLRANPDVKGVFVGYDGMDSNLFAAAKSAGVTLPKIYSQGTLPTSIQSLQSGALAASSPIDYDELGYRLADALARIFTGQTAAAQKIDVQYEQPMIWSTQFKNVPAATNDNEFPAVFPGYADAYLKLWK